MARFSGFEGNPYDGANCRPRDQRSAYLNRRNRHSLGSSLLESSHPSKKIRLSGDRRGVYVRRQAAAAGRPVLEAIIDRCSVATLPMVAFWLRDREHALAIEAQVARSTH